MLKAMIPTEFLRGILGLLALGCAYMSGRTLAAVRKGEIKASRHYGWLVRTIICVAALSFRHGVGVLEIVIWTGAIAAFVGGMWQAGKRQPAEDLTGEMFPREDEKD
jgi:uncharacterized membrane protein